MAITLSQNDIKKLDATTSRARVSFEKYATGRPEVLVENDDYTFGNDESISIKAKDTDGLKIKAYNWARKHSYRLAVCRPVSSRERKEIDALSKLAGKGATVVQFVRVETPAETPPADSPADDTPAETATNGSGESENVSKEVEKVAA